MRAKGSTTWDAEGVRCGGARRGDLAVDHDTGFGQFASEDIGEVPFTEGCFQ